MTESLRGLTGSGSVSLRTCFEIEVSGGLFRSLGHVIHASVPHGFDGSAVGVRASVVVKSR
jgi:hypothetical protein